MAAYFKDKHACWHLKYFILVKNPRKIQKAWLGCDLPRRRGPSSDRTPRGRPQHRHPQQPPAQDQVQF